MPTRRQAAMLAVLRDMGTWPIPPRSPSWDTNEIKTYRQGYIYLIDHSLDYLQQPNRSLKQQQHDERCMRVANFFDSRTPYEVNCVKIPHGTKVADWKQYWDDELATKTDEDLLIIYFHGKAYGLNQEYKWQFQKGLLVNAHDFITKINGGSSDCTFFLDCFFHTRMTKGLKWKLDNAAMMDFIFSPYQVHTGNGAVIDHEGDWSKAFVRNMIKFVEGEGQTPSHHVPIKTIPEVMAKDHQMYHNQGSGFKLVRHGRDNRPVRRLVLDPVMVWSTEEFQFFGRVIRGSDDDVEEPEVEPEPESEPETEDEGVEEDFDGAAPFAFDQMGRLIEDDHDDDAGFGNEMFVDGADED